MSSHRKCGFCKGVVPVKETECPFCGKSLENYGALGAWIEDFLPKDRPLTKMLAALAVAMYLLVGMVAGGPSILGPSTYTLIHFGASFPPYIIEGQWWRLITALFMHGDIMHIGFNLYALWLLGTLIENSFGKVRTLIIFVVTGLVSTLLSFGWGFIYFELLQAIGMDPSGSASVFTPSVGMSGSLTGLIGVGVSAGHRVKTVQGAQIRHVMLRWMGFIVVFGLIVDQVDNAAHIGGFLAGLALGQVMPLKDQASNRAGYFYGAGAALSALLIVGALVAQFATIPTQYPPDSMVYPTAVFGQIVREADLNDPDYISAAKGCENSLGALEQEKDPKKLAEEREIAVANCDELNYIQPFFTPSYWASAYAHHENGDDDTACRKLRVALLMEVYGQPQLAGRITNELKALNAAAGCGLEVPEMTPIQINF